MPWLQITLTTDQANAEQLSDTLSTIGAVAVTLQDGADQPIYEPERNTTPIWNNTQVIGLFAEEVHPQTVITALTEQLAPQPLPPLQAEVLPDQDWQRACLEDFQPMQFGKRLWICPSWHTPPVADAINIMLDPGLAFGTGTHPTTALCLAWLDAQANLHGQTVIDYGCGSGILAIAAAKLGASAVWAIDNDPQALVATQENAQRNQVATAIHTALPEQRPPDLPVDVLLANILAAPLLELQKQFVRHLKVRGRLVLSGILTTQVSEIRTAYQTDCNDFVVSGQEEWACITARKVESA